MAVLEKEKKERIEELEELLTAYEQVIDLTESELRFKDAQIQALNNVIDYFAGERGKSKPHG